MKELAKLWVEYKKDIDKQWEEGTKVSPGWSVGEDGRMITATVMGFYDWLAKKYGFEKEE